MFSLPLLKTKEVEKVFNEVENPLVKVLDGYGI